HDNGNESAGCLNHGILLIYTINSTVDNNEVYDNTGEVVDGCYTGGHGIKLFTFSNYNSITNNTIYGNAVAGIYAKKECMYNYAAYNELYENGKFVGGPTEIGCVAHDGTVYKCGDMVVQSCTFNGDLNCPVGHGLIIGAEGISIDGRGYVLNGVEPGTCGGLGVQRSGIYNIAHDDITIKNLEIENFCNGIYLRGNEDTGDIVDNNIISNCEIHHNGNDAEATATHGIKLKYVSQSTISDNWIHHNRGGGDSCEGGGNGIFLYAGDYNLIFNNTVCDNKKAGIFTKMKPRYNNISYNEVKGNGQGGIVLRCKCCNSFSIEHNLATDNKGPGIYIGGPDNTLRFNTVTNNKNGSIYRNDASIANGIRVSREADNITLVENDVTGNDDVDIYVREGLTALGYNNTYQTFLNYEDSLSLTGEGEEEVEGKRMVVWEEMLKEVKLGMEIPPVKVTPLMATLIVVIALAFILYGYLRKRT
ncbi:MAG TPA: hypothetical protein C5S37_05185, partial [Methanophagales archaeon]|nr:hypothetical protein [Methanophagales archaeon]